jgi:hypothetical protein
MKDIKPVSKLKNQPLTSSPQAGYPSAIMDDTVYTMDDSRVLMGGEVSTASSVKGRIKTVKPSSTIRPYR